MAHRGTAAQQPPELNPAELVWANVKGEEVANLCADDLAEMGDALRTGMARIQKHPTLSFGFLQHTALSL